MRRVHMLKTYRTAIEVLKADKNYPVPNHIAEELVEAGAAVYLDADEPERAVRAAEEDAARQSRRPKSARKKEPSKEEESDDE